MTTRIVQVIFSDEATRGTGADSENLVRRVPALYTLDGDLICQFDCGSEGNVPSTEQFVSDHALRRLERQAS